MTKAEGSKPAPAELKADTKVTSAGRNPHAHHGYVNTPVYHASTLLYRSAEDYVGNKTQYHYGRRGTPTSEALENAIRDLEGPACAAVALLPSGLAAVSTAFLSVLKSGDHVLVTDSAYGPTRTFCDTVLARTRMRTSSALGTGWSTSSIRSTSGGPYRSWTTAFIASHHRRQGPKVAAPHAGAATPSTIRSRSPRTAI